MEDSPYSDLKSSLSAVPVKALNYSCRLTLSNNLDTKLPLQSERHYAKDYRGLAEQIGLPYQISKKFEEFENRTMRILDAWEVHVDATLDKLITYLENMDRYDIIRELIPSLKENVNAYFSYQKSIESPIQVAEVTPGPMNLQSRRGVITRDDVHTGECTIYDAYVSYAEEDSGIAAEFARVLESPQVGLKLFIRGRDMLAGCAELDSNIELIKNRCRHMLIILTPNFIKSPALEFQVSFAGTLAIEQKQRILIPVILTSCEIPPILNSVSKIDFTKEYTHDWMMDKLITSLMPEDRIFLSSAAKCSPKVRSVMPNPACSISVESRPTITFPPSTRYSLSSGNSSNFALSITLPADTSNDDNKDSGVCSEMKDSTVTCSEIKESMITSSEIKESVSISEIKEPVCCSEVKETLPKSNSKKIQQKIRSIFNLKGNSTNVSSSSFSSSATSGFHSQSCSHIKSLENSSDHRTYDTSL